MRPVTTTTRLALVCVHVLIVCIFVGRMAAFSGVLERPQLQERPEKVQATLLDRRS